MSMEQTLEHLRSELQGVAAGWRDNVATLDDLLAVVLRLDPYTMDAARFNRIEPEQVTPEDREQAKQAAYRAAFHVPASRRRR